MTFENGLKGMVQDIQKDTIGCILFGSDVEIKEGTKVMRTKKKAGVPVGDKFIGRVVNALGAPIDGAGEIEAEDYRPIENEAPGIVDRKSVSVPMETGILSIDSMFPIGRGQRELIIGDRQTGKTVSYTHLPWAVLILYRVAEPIPIIEPIAKTRPNTGRIRFRAASPSAPHL